MKINNARSCHGIGRSFFFAYAVFFHSHSMGDGVQILFIYLYFIGVRGGIVVKALRYKPAGRGFDS